MASSDKDLGAKKEAAILALLSARSMEDAARTAGVPARTLSRWMKEKDFQAACRRTRSQAFEQQLGRLQQAASAVVTTLLKLAIDPAAPPAVRARAAWYVLTLATKAFEIEDLEARVTELEEAAGES
jgi:regulator of sirC expression with transglutaminase-like and TPR domain